MARAAECLRAMEATNEALVTHYSYAIRYRGALERIPAMAGHPDPAKACVNIIAFVERALGDET
ncbi:MAG: hypothetical protein H0U59_01220 [Gemmatimonadaceae bacterium]|nr:hypothetical protein [Gemmatimonadaceae bacterium]